MRTKNSALNYDNCYSLTSIIGMILFFVLLITEFVTDAKINELNYDIMNKNRAKLYEQSILEYKGQLDAGKTRAPYKAQSQQCCKAIPNKPLPISAIPSRFKYGF